MWLIFLFKYLIFIALITNCGYYMKERDLGLFDSDFQKSTAAPSVYFA